MNANTHTPAAAVRPARPEDYPGIARLGDPHAGPEQLSQRAARLLGYDQHSAATDPQFHRLVAEAGNALVATATIRADWAGVVQAGRFWVDAFVDPAWRGRGLGATLVDHLERAVPGPVRELGACLREDHVPATEHLAEQGFEERFRSWGAHLDLRAFEPSAYAGLLARLEAAGYRFVPYPELHAPDKEARLLALKRHVDRDIVAFEPIVPAASEDVLDEGYLPDGLIVALAPDGEMVGLASLRREGPEGPIGCGLTGVHRDHRGRGLATALKVRSLEVAKALGATTIGTGGGGANLAMRRVNERLGFVVEPLWLTFISERGGRAHEVTHGA